MGDGIRGHSTVVPRPFPHYQWAVGFPSNTYNIPCVAREEQTQEILLGDPITNLNDMSGNHITNLNEYSKRSLFGAYIHNAQNTVNRIFTCVEYTQQGSRVKLGCFVLKSFRDNVYLGSWECIN